MPNAHHRKKYAKPNEKINFTYKQFNYCSHLVFFPNKEFTDPLGLPRPLLEVLALRGGKESLCFFASIFQYCKTKFK